MQYPGASCGATIAPLILHWVTLQDNGGWSMTYRAAGRTVRRAMRAANANCADFDQRGVTRPQNGACDVGAFEYGARPGLTGISPTFVAPAVQVLWLMANGSKLYGGASASRCTMEWQSTGDDLHQ